MKIEVYLDDKMFRRFSYFDTFRRRKAWRAPMTFASIMGAFALVCFLFAHMEGAILLGSVLLIVGLGMPVTYLLSFHLSVNKQASALGLARPKLVYTLQMNANSKMFSVDNGREHVDLKWGDVYRIYRSSSAAYLYATPQRAFILPYSCIDNPTDTLWPLVKSKMPEEKIIDLR